LRSGDVKAKLQTLLPKWFHCLITQEPPDGNYAHLASQRMQFAYVSLPPGDKQFKVQCHIHSGGLEPGERVRVKCCLGNACPYRKGVDAPVGDEMAEIPGDAKHEDDVHDALYSYLLAEEEAVESESADNAERILDIIEGDQDTETAKSKETHFDRQIFPIQKPISAFESMYKKFMLVSDAKYLIAVTTTAHPSIYIAARRHACSCVVLLRKGCDHALGHGNSERRGRGPGHGEDRLWGMHRREGLYRTFKFLKRSHAAGHCTPTSSSPSGCT